MLEIARKNCFKCRLETIIINNSQYFWINLKDFEVETESKWLNIFSKRGNSSMYSALNTLSEHTYLEIPKKLLHALFCLFLKSLKDFSLTLS